MKKILVLALLLSGCATVTPINVGTYSVADIPKALTYEQMQDNAVLNRKLRKLMEFKIQLADTGLAKTERKALHVRIVSGGVIMYVTGGKVDWWQ